MRSKYHRVKGPTPNSRHRERMTFSPFLKSDILGFAKRTGAGQRKERYTMSLQKAEQFLQNKGFLDHVIRLEESTATVVEAAEALGVEPGRIAKTMSFLQGEQAVLISDRRNSPCGQSQI